MFWRRQLESYARSAESVPLLVEVGRMTTGFCLLWGLFNLLLGRDMPFSELLLTAVLNFVLLGIGFGILRRMARRLNSPSASGA